MNHLAHALIADPGGVEFALGSALGDFTHGHPDPAWPAARQAGLRFHRAIDIFTDAHPEVVSARALFDPPLRRYAGILLDVWFDHLLARDFARWSAEPLRDFSRRWLDLLDARTAELPRALHEFLAFMHTHGLPAAYGDDAMIGRVLLGIAARLSHPSPVGAALPVLRERAVPLQRHFDAFFPELVARARDLRANLLA